MKDLYTTPLCRVLVVQASGMICTSGEVPNFNDKTDEITIIWG
jgi:hypothetical protein